MAQTVSVRAFLVTCGPNSPLSHDVEYSVLSSEWDGEYLEMIGSLPKKLKAVPEYNSPSERKADQKKK